MDLMNPIRAAPVNLPLPIYTYTRIETAQTARVLTLHPAAGKYDPLFGSLSTIHLDSPSRPPYETISYVWGKPVLSDIIVLDGAIHWLTRSLSNALRRLRHKTECRVVWADQICVNQQDPAERNQQVGLMGKLYKEAKTVLVWLGEDEEGLGVKTAGLLAELDDVFEGFMGPRDGKKGDSYDARLMQIAEYKWEAFRSMIHLPWASQEASISLMCVLKSTKDVKLTKHIHLL